MFKLIKSRKGYEDHWLIGKHKVFSDDLVEILRQEDMEDQLVAILDKYRHTPEGLVWPEKVVR